MGPNYKVITEEGFGGWKYRVLDAQGQEVASEGGFGAKREAEIAGQLAAAALID